MKLCSLLPFLMAAVAWDVSPAQALVANSSQRRFRKQYSNGCTNLAAATLDIVDEQKNKDPLLYFLSPPLPPQPTLQIQREANEARASAERMYSMSQVLDDAAQEMSTAAMIDEAARDMSAAAALIESVDRILTRLTPHLSESHPVGQSASVPRENDSSLGATMNRMLQRLEPLTNSKHVVGNQVQLNRNMKEMSSTDAVNTMPFFCSLPSKSKVDDRRERVASLPTLNEHNLGTLKKTRQKQNGNAGVAPNNVPFFCTSENVVNTDSVRSPSRHSSSVEEANKKTPVSHGTLPVSRAVTLRIPQSQHFKEQSTESSKHGNFAEHISSNIQNQFQSILADLGMIDGNRR